MSTFRDSPLPPIDDPDAYDAIFTHKSYTALPAHVATTEHLAQDWERWALLGSSYLETTVMSILHKEFHLSRPSDLTRKKDAIVKNETVAEWAVGYDMPKWIKAHAPSLDVVKSPVHRASVFKAYVGAYAFQCSHAPEGNVYKSLLEWLEPIIDVEIRMLHQVDYDLAALLAGTDLNASPHSAPLQLPLPRSPLVCDCSLTVVLIPVV